MRLGDRFKNPLVAGALIGALAALLVGGAGQLRLWMSAGPYTESTGATQGLDLWTYYSMARAVWASPNGITYSYPYDLYWPTPPVAFQLPITLLAWIGRITGLPAAFEIGRVLGGAGSGAAIAALGLFFPAGFWRRWFYIAAVAGGAFFSLGAVALAIQTAGWPGLTELWYYQPQAEGRLFWWLPFLFQNLRMPLECLYHAVVIGALACLAWRKYRWAAALGAVVWMCNPFSAVALHAAVVPWLTWRVWETRGAARRRFVAQLAVWLGINAVAAVYYGWFLNQWPAYRALHDLYRSAYNPPLEWWRVGLLVLPYGLALVASLVVRPYRRAVWARPTWRLFAIMAVAHVALLQQSAVLGEKSMQAFHYNRGYLHLALVMVAWRVLVVMLRRHRLLADADTRNAWRPRHFANRGARLAARIAAAVVLVTTMDQVLFFMYVGMRDSGDGLVASDYATLARTIPAEPGPMLVLTEPVTLPGSYITAFTPHVAWDAQETMVVPFYAERAALVEEALRGKHGGVAALGIDYAVVYRDNSMRLEALEQQGWARVAEGKSLLLYRAPSPQPGKNPDRAELMGANAK